MTSSFANIGIKFHHGLRQRRSKFTPNFVETKTLFFSSLSKPRQSSNLEKIVSFSRFNRIDSTSTMEFGLKYDEPERYSKELDVAVRAVQLACFLCQRVQESIISKSGDEILSKDDHSPVTVAGNPLTLFRSDFALGSFGIFLCIYRLRLKCGSVMLMFLPGVRLLHCFWIFVIITFLILVQFFNFFEW